MGDKVRLFNWCKNICVKIFKQIFVMPKTQHQHQWTILARKRQRSWQTFVSIFFQVHSCATNSSQTSSQHCWIRAFFFYISDTTLTVHSKDDFVGSLYWQSCKDREQFCITRSFCPAPSYINIPLSTDNLAGWGISAWD